MSAIAIAAVIEQVAWEFDVTAAEIVGADQRRWLVAARAAVAWLAHQHRVASRQDVASALNCHVSRVDARRRRGAALREASVEYRELFDRLEAVLLAAELPPATSAVRRVRPGAHPRSFWRLAEFVVIGLGLRAGDPVEAIANRIDRPVEKVAAWARAVAA